MNKTLGKNVLRTSAFALAYLALVGAEVKALPISSSAVVGETYSTTGVVDTTGVTGAPSTIGFNAVTTGSFGLISNVSLGAFSVSTLNDGASTTYTNTPFTINYKPLAVNTSNFPDNPIKISGVLNGTVTGTAFGNTSSVVATFNQITGSVFHSIDGKYESALSLSSAALPLVPSTSGGGLTTIEASVVTSATTVAPPDSGNGSGPGKGTPTPEPTTLAILATSILGFGLRQRLRSTRKGS